MQERYRDTWAEVDLGAIAHNVHEVKQHIGTKVKLMAVVKANAYGHGDVRVATVALANGADTLGVATLGEAMVLREAGLQAPILVLGYVAAENLAVAAQNRIDLTVVSVDHARALAAIDRQLQEANVDEGADTDRPMDGREFVSYSVHLKLDTGMSRLGVRSVAELEQAVAALWGTRAHITGAFTHFARADEVDKTHALQQVERVKAWFQRLQEIVPNSADLILHAANSAAIHDLPDSYFSMVRLGISLYGVYPSTEVNKSALSLRQALRLYTRVVHLKQVPPGTAVSYGGTFITTQETRLATLPIGYGDGLFRILSNRGFVTIDGQRCPIVGRICMDQTIVDVTTLPQVRLGDRVTIYDENSLDELAKLAETIPYELLCAISGRVRRVYTEGV